MSDHSQNHSTKWHMAMMVLCCLVPMVAAVALWYFGVSSGLLYFGVMLLCPAMHFLMMGKHGRHSREGSASRDAKSPLKKDDASDKGECH